MRGLWLWHETIHGKYFKKGGGEGGLSKSISILTARELESSRFIKTRRQTSPVVFLRVARDLRNLGKFSIKRWSILKAENGIFYEMALFPLFFLFPFFIFIFFPPNGSVLNTLN